MGAHGVEREHLMCDDDPNGQPMMWDLHYDGCNFAEYTDCGDRPVCDANDQNCDDDEGFVCPEPTGLWEDPESCCHWYQCEEGRAFHMDCPYCKCNGVKILALIFPFMFNQKYWK